MLDAVDGVVDKRPGEGQLDGALGGQRQGGEGGGDAGGLEVPAGQGGDEVADRVGVQAAGEEHAREALPDGAAEEGLLGVVDLEVGGDGPDAALAGEEGIGVGVRQGLRQGGLAPRGGGGGGPDLLGGREAGRADGVGGEEGGCLGGCLGSHGVPLLARCVFPRGSSGRGMVRRGFLGRADDVGKPTTAEGREACS